MQNPMSKNNELRPKCIECGSKQVISKGVSWYCKACGRWFIKVRRTNKWVEDIKREVAEMKSNETNNE